MLQVTNLTKSYTAGHGEVTALRGVNFTVESGEFASIIGKSGSGKSTLLSLLGALDSPTSGSVIVDDVDITGLSPAAGTQYRAKKIGFVFQYYNLIPNLTALENVMLALEYGGVPAKDRRARAARLLDEVGLTTEEQFRRPARLSGGQQQRVAIARALANEPALILADEPTGNLDSETGAAIFSLLHRLSRDEHTTIVVVTHDLEIAGKTDHTFTLKDGHITSNKH